MIAQAQTALQAADVLCGYTVYIDLVRPLYPDKEVYATGMTRELDRCRWALETAKGGKTVALVCSGDAGVYGMASPLLELAEHCPEVEVEIVRRGGGFLSGALQPVVQRPRRLPAKGRSHSAGQWQGPGHGLRAGALHWP